MAQEIAVRQKGQLTIPDRYPAEFRKVINPEAWARAIVYGEKYTEPDPNFISRMLALLSIMADTPEEAFAQAGVRRVQKWVPDQPNATSGPFEITDLYVAESDFETGNPTYVIISAMHLETGEAFKATTGATNIQATIIGLLNNGVWPIRCQIKRGDSKDAGGKYLLFLLPPD
jgi:hypothetical protein